jgi:hypothetical protein
MAFNKIISLWIISGACATQVFGATAHRDLENREQTLRFSLDVINGEASYQVRHVGANHYTTTIESSPLGIVRTDDDFSKELELVSCSEISRVIDDYTLVSGKKTHVHDEGVEQTFHLKNSKSESIDLIVRMYAEGVAFRYAFPENARQLKFITRETTGFHLPMGGKVWLQPYSKVATWAPAYENTYANGIPIGSRSPGPEGWAMPALYQTSSGWTFITEADLDGNYFASHFQPDPKGGLYLLRPPEEEETYGVAPQFAAITQPWHSPWRLILFSENLADIVQSNLVTSLAHPSTIEDSSWVHPGCSSWSWWSDMASPADFNKLTPFVDLSAQEGWPYSTIDLEWPYMNDGDIASLIKYAEKKNVGLILWYNSGGAHNHVPEAGPRDLLANPSAREAELSRIAKLGAKGIKVDFMQSDKQYVIGLYIDILESAARHHLIVDFHGATLPRGWSRTYPNLISMEAVSGAEQYWSQDFAENAQTTDAIYPFTRNVVGSMDYTPMVFNSPANLKAHKTTNAHELALAIVFESGIQHLIVTPKDIAEQPEYIRDFLHALPTAWDETRLLAGRPGELAVLARRHNSTWYVAGINGEKVSQQLPLQLGFLGAGHFKISLISDGDSPSEFKHQEQTVASNDSLEIELAARGGFAARIDPQN